MRKRPTILCFVLLSLVGYAGSVPAEPELLVGAGELRIGVLAKRGAERTLQKWNPTAVYLGERMPERTFRIVPMEFDEIPLLVKNGLVDFVIVNPAIYVDLSVRFAALRTLTLNNRLSRERHGTQFGSVIFTRSDNRHLNELADLRHGRIAAVHPSSLGGWMMAYREFLRQGVAREGFSDLDFSETHDKVVERVLSGRADAGIVRTDTLERMADEGRIRSEQLKVLNARELAGFPLRLSTRLYPEWPIAKLAHVRPELADRVALALMQLAADHPAALAANIHGWTVAQDYQPVHELLKELKLSPYQDFSRIRLWDAVASYWYWVSLGAAALLVLSLMYLRIRRLLDTLKQQQGALMAEEERFRHTFEQSAAGIMQVSTEGEFIHFNQQMCSLIGYTELQLRELNLNEITHGDDLPSLLAGFTRLQHGHIGALHTELRLLRSDSSPQWVALALSCVRDLQGNIKYLTGNLVDISQRKALEHQLREERITTQLILDTAGDGILGLDRSGKHTFVNPAAAKMLGYRVTQMLSRDSHALWHHKRPDGSVFPKEECPITGVLRDGEAHRGKAAVFWRANGEALEVDFVSTPIIDENEITGAVVVFRPVGRTAKSHVED